MNVIVGVIVDYVKTSRIEIEEEDIENSNTGNKEKITLESLSVQISVLQENIQELKKELK